LLRCKWSNVPRGSQLYMWLVTALGKVTVGNKSGGHRGLSLGTLPEQHQPFEIILRKCFPIEYLSRDGSIDISVNLSSIGRALPDLRQLDGELSKNIVFALAAYRSACWFCMRKARYKKWLQNQMLWQETFRNPKWQTWPCRTAHLFTHFERMNELVDMFAAQRAPERDVLALYRVEDHLDGWAIQFREYELCANQSAGAARPSHPHPYDIDQCRNRLLRPKQILTLNTMLSYSPSPRIWTWRPPAENGRLRWLIVPHRVPKTNSAQQTFRATRISNGVRVRPQFSYNRSTRSFSGHLADDEIVLLPGQCLHVLSLMWDGEYHTCIAEQCSSRRPFSTAPTPAGRHPPQRRAAGGVARLDHSARKEGANTNHWSPPQADAMRASATGKALGRWSWVWSWMLG